MARPSMIGPTPRPPMQSYSRPSTQRSAPQSNNLAGRPSLTRPATRPAPQSGALPASPRRALPGLGERSATRPDLGNLHRPFERPFTRPDNANPARADGGNRHAGDLRPDGHPGHLNPNFQHNWNWSTNRHHWGDRPWWNTSSHDGWYCGSWNYGWNDPWYHRNYYPYLPWPGYYVADYYPGTAAAIGWGLAAWGLGDLYYQLGYGSYCNPYPVLPVITLTGTTVDYSEPVAALAAQRAPAGEAAAALDAAKLLDESRDAFKHNDYLAALGLADKAIALLPGDSVTHEYRALVLFALGKYPEAAAVLNSVLASGPGWDWATMVQLYDSQQSYADQLRKLEDFTTANPNLAAARFVLGYHYLVCGHLAEAAAEFEAVTRLQPADGVARQLLNLTRSSATPGATNAPAAAPAAAPDPGAAARPATAAPAPQQLVGTWQVDRGKDGTVTLDLTAPGRFTWTFAKAAKLNQLEGHYSINEKGLLVLDSGDSQMVGSVALTDDNRLHFTLAGGPGGDPGLLFTKKP